MTFCYFTGTNRTADNPIINTMIKSARAVGVTEEFHVFSPQPVDDSTYTTYHPIWSSQPWRSHMAKLDFLRQLANTDYDYCVWLDSDNYFTRHPGDLSNLIRDNKCWVSMEGEITGPNVRHKDWWSMKFAGNEIIDKMRALGCGDRIWNTNGGMWIVRRDAITEFADKCEQVFQALKPDHQTVTDEPPLAIACMTMTPDAELNTIEHYGDTWAIDWAGRIFKNRLPDGQPWLYEVWLTGEQHTINPAIVHAMGSKGAMRRAAGGRGPVPTRTVAVSDAMSAEPVGKMLSKIFAECGVNRPECSTCQDWVAQMDRWGVEGCQKNRRQILHRLAEASDTASWLDMIRVAAKGYISTAALLDEAIKRASA